MLEPIVRLGAAEAQKALARGPEAFAAQAGDAARIVGAFEQEHRQAVRVDAQVHADRRHIREDVKRAGRHDHVDAPDVCLKSRPHLHQIEESNHREDQRGRVHDATRRREFHRERGEEQPQLHDEAAMPPEAFELFGIDRPREEFVRFAGIAREQPSEIFGLQVARVAGDELTKAPAQ